MVAGHAALPLGQGQVRSGMERRGQVDQVWRAASQFREGMMTSESLRILVVDDDYFMAERLSREIRANGDIVVGPVADVHDALDLACVVQAAILDVKVQDETSFQIADSLIHHDVPFIFLIGYDPQVVPSRFARQHIYAKPSHAAPLLHDLHERHRAASEAADSVEAVVIEMICRGREMMPDEASAERLVEGALMRAITEAPQDEPKGDDIRARLFALFQDEYRQRGRLRLH